MALEQHLLSTSQQHVIAGQAEFGDYKLDPCKYPRRGANKPAFSHEGANKEVIDHGVLNQS